MYTDIFTNLATEPDKKFAYIQLRIDIILYSYDDIEFVESNQPQLGDSLILFLNNQNPLTFATARQLIKGIIFQKVNID